MEATKDRGVLVKVLAVCGFEPGVEAIRSSETFRRLGAEIIVADGLAARDQAFHEQSTIYPDKTERLEAYELALTAGKRLLRDAPLGYGDLQATVVFEENVPNNTLPIIWKRSGDWIPLFPRE